MRISLLETDKYSFIHSYFLSFIQFLMPSFDHLLSTFSFFPQLNTFITLKPMLYETEVHSASQLSIRAVICQKQISVEGNGHCCHRPSSNWESRHSCTGFPFSHTKYLDIMQERGADMQPVKQQSSNYHILN